MTHLPQSVSTRRKSPIPTTPSLSMSQSNGPPLPHSAHLVGRQRSGYVQRAINATQNAGNGLSPVRRWIVHPDELGVALTDEPFRHVLVVRVTRVVEKIHEGPLGAVHPNVW